MNNFDTSSTGVDLDLVCHWNTDTAYILADECFSIVWDDGDSLINDRYWGVRVLQYIDHGNIEPLDLLNESSYTFKKSDIIDPLLAENNIDDLNDDTLRLFDKYFKQLTKSELFQYIHETVYGDNEAIQFYYHNLTPCYTVISSRGYCQGDYLEIIIPDALFKMWGKDKTDQAINELSVTIDHLLWDCPLYCRLNIDECTDDAVEIYFDDYLESLYDYDKEKIMNIADDIIKHDEKAYILEWLDDNLPETPDYV